MRGTDSPAPWLTNDSQRRYRRANTPFTDTATPLHCFYGLCTCIDGGVLCVPPSLDGHADAVNATTIVSVMTAITLRITVSSAAALRLDASRRFDLG
jgi:hypothetical protein